MHRAQWIAAGLAITIAGCGDSSSNASKNTTSKREQSKTSAKTSAFESPLSEALGMDNEPKSYERMSKKMEKEIQQCMAKEGFEYVPVTNQFISFDSQSVDFPGPDNPSWRKEYGYGITIQRLNPNNEAFESPIPDIKDPNQEIVDKMSKAERRAYYLALDGYDPDELTEAIEGAPPIPPPGATLDGTEPQTKGCRTKAYAAMNENVMNNPDNQDVIQELFDSLQKKIDEDPATKKLLSSYKKCTAKAGFSNLKTTQSGYEYINKKIGEIIPNGESPGGVLQGGNVIIAGDPGSGSLSEGGGDTLSEEQKTSLKQLLKEEIQMAEADYTCQEQLNFLEVQDDIRIRVEEEVATDRREDISNLKPGTSGGIGQG